MLAAALGALAFGHVEFGVTASLIIGSVPEDSAEPTSTSRRRRRRTPPARASLSEFAWLTFRVSGAYFPS